MVYCDELVYRPGFRLAPVVPGIGSGSHHDPDQDEALSKDVLVKQIEKKNYLH